MFPALFFALRSFFPKGRGIYLFTVLPVGIRRLGILETGIVVVWWEGRHVSPIEGRYRSFFTHTAEHGAYKMHAYVLWCGSLRGRLICTTANLVWKNYFFKKIII